MYALTCACEADLDKSTFDKFQNFFVIFLTYGLAEFLRRAKI